MNKMKFIVFALIVLFIVDVSMFIVFLKSSEHYGTNTSETPSNDMHKDAKISIIIEHGELMIIEKKDDK